MLFDVYYYYCLHIHEVICIGYTYLWVSHSCEDEAHTSSTEILKECVLTTIEHKYTQHTLQIFYWHSWKKKDLFGIDEKILLVLVLGI